MSLTRAVKTTAPTFLLRQILQKLAFQRTWLGVAVSVVMSSNDAKLLLFLLFWHEQQSRSLDSLKQPSLVSAQINLLSRRHRRPISILRCPCTHELNQAIVLQKFSLTFSRIKRPFYKNVRIKNYGLEFEIQMETRESRSAIFLPESKVFRTVRLVEIKINNKSLSNN